MFTFVVAALKIAEPVLTPFLTKLFKGKTGTNAKAHAGGAVSAASMLPATHDYVMGKLGSVVTSFGDGFAGGLIQPAFDLGQALAAFAASYLVGFAITWLTSNTE